jgi:hypothetical protein
MSNKEIVESIRKYGIFKIDSYLDNTEVLKIINELNHHYDKIPHGSQFCDSDSENPIQYNSYPSGKALVLMDSKNSIPFANNIFDRDFFKTISEDYLGKNCQRNLQTFSTYEYKKIDQSEWPRNYYFHFDPYRALKFFIYLNDTNEDNGAFRAIPGSHHLCRSVREKNDINLLLREKYLISHHDELSSYKEEDYVFYGGPSGTLLIFDTDIAHSGGIIKKDGLERMVVLNHNR